MKEPFQKLGNIGEEIACRYLREKLYIILARNYRTPGGEIDIVAKKKDLLVFIEVKCRLTERFGKPYEAVNFFKKIHFQRAILWFFKKNQVKEKKFRFDIISIVLNKDRSVKELRHFEGVDLPEIDI